MLSYNARAHLNQQTAHVSIYIKFMFYGTVPGFIVLFAGVQCPVRTIQLKKKGAER